MIVEEKVHGFDVRHLESVDRLSFVFLRTEQLYDLVNCQEASQPVPFIILTDKEAIIAIGSFVPTATEHDVSQRGTDGLTKRGEVNRVRSLIRRLLPWI